MIAAGLVYQPRALLVTAATVVAAFLLGRALAGKLGLTFAGGIEELAAGLGIGLGILALVMFVVGLAGGYYALVSIAVLGVAILLGHREFARIGTIFAGLHRRWGSQTEGPESIRAPLGTVLVVTAFVFLIPALMVILAPSLTFDVLKYHLAEVKTYTVRHELVAMPLVEFRYFPQNVEVLMTLANTLGGQPAAQMIPPIFFALSLAVTYALARRFGTNLTGGLLAVLAGATIPCVHWTGSVAKNDLAMAAYILLALLGFVRWRETQDFRWIQAGVFFLAMAAGVKHVALYGCPPLLVLFGYATWRQPRRWRAAMSLVVIFAVFGLYWHARAFAATGNPVYPVRPGQAATTVVANKGPGWKSIPQRLVKLPLKLYAPGKGNFESPLEHPVGLMLLFFAPVWLLLGKPMKSAERVALCFAVAYLLYWWLSVPALRFASGPLLLISASVGWRVAALYGTRPTAARAIMLGTLGYVIVFAWCGVQIIEVNGPQLAYFAGRLNSEGYLREALATFRSTEYLRGVARPGQGVFGVMDCSVAYAPDPASFDCTFGKTDQAIRDTVACKFEQEHFEYLIRPASGLGSAAESAIPGAQKVYQDSDFWVFKTVR